MSERRERLLFRLTRSSLIVANTGRPFSLHGLIAVVYGWTSTKGEEGLEWPEADRRFVDENHARRVVDERREAKRSHLQDPYERNSQSSQQSQTVQSYSGRTLYELLQNAVDASSEKPIGYKGVGFRSVLNITNSPEIHSGSLHARWSPEIAEETVGAAAKNLPVLAFPKWSENRPRELDDYDTVVVLPLTPEARATIETEWKKFLSDPSIVVFISGLAMVSWDHNGSVVTWQRTETGNRVSITQTEAGEPELVSRWEMFDSDSSRVAMPITGSGAMMQAPEDTSSTLRCFFPTEDSNPFRNFLIHGEFPLTPDRKHIDVRHPETDRVIRDVALAIAQIAATRTNLAEVLDVLRLRESVPHGEDTLSGKICSEVRITISNSQLQSLNGDMLSSFRTCPRQFPEQHLSRERRLELWEAFKECVATHREGGLDNLHMLPCGLETAEREITLLWLNPDASLSIQELRSLPWAKCEGVAQPGNSDFLFAPPKSEVRVPDIPEGIALKFLDRGLHSDLVDRLGYNSTWFLANLLKVATFDMEQVVTTAVFPVLEQSGTSDAILAFLRDLWLATPREKGLRFDYRAPWKEKLSLICRVRCEDGKWRSAIEVYACRKWTGSDFLERFLASRTDRGFLHAPLSCDGEIEQWSDFYQWLGVGWAPKVIPLVLEHRKKEGWIWRDGKFACPAEEPEDWNAYCETEWGSRYRQDRIEKRSPRLKLDWTIDGDFSLLSHPGAFESLRNCWDYFHFYSESKCGWSNNQKEDNDDIEKRTTSYLFWRLKKIEWLLCSDDDSRKHRPVDCFQKGEVSSSRALKPFVAQLPPDFPEEMATDLGIRSSFEKLGIEDWRRWIERAQQLDPAGNLNQREVIRRLYSSVLQYAAPPHNRAPFKGLDVWWMERLRDRENWRLAPAGDGFGAYLDRPEFEPLRLSGMFVFPARLDDKAGKAEGLFGILRLSEKLNGNPCYSDAWAMEAIEQRIRSRFEFIVSYLGLNRGEKGHERLARQLGEIRFQGTNDLSVTWHLEGVSSSIQVTESFTHESDGKWTLIIKGSRHLEVSDPIWEKVAETILLACGFGSTERASNLRDILTYPSDRLKEKLTSLGVAPETVEEARLGSLEEPESSLPPEGRASPLTEPSSPIVDHGGPRPKPSPGIPSQEPGPSLPAERTFNPARPHPETGIPAQQKLYSMLTERLSPCGWTVSHEVSDEDIPTRTDIVLEHPDHDPFYIEVKSMNARQIYWSERQIRMAEAKSPRYCLALVAGDPSEVGWILNPLETLKAHPRKVAWNWKTRSTSGELDGSWRPVESPPMEKADSFKAIVTFPSDFHDKLRKGVDFLADFLATERPDE